MSHETDRELEWGTADGHLVKIKDMTDGHLVNVINWIADNSRNYPTYTHGIMVAEAKYRQVLLFAEGKAYPQNVGNRWVLIDPVSGVGKIEKPPAEYIEAVKDNEIYQSMSKTTREKRKARK